MTHKTVALMVMIGLFGASAASAQSGSVKKKDGSTVSGDIVGQVVWAMPDAPKMAVAYGKDIDKIDETGVHLKDQVFLVVTGVSSQTDPAIAKATKPADVLKIVIPITGKTIGAQRVDDSLMKTVETTGRGAGLGVGTAPLGGGGRVYYIKQIRTDVPAYPLAGEMKVDNGVYSITPAVRVMTKAGLVSVPVDQVVAVKK